MDPVEVKVRAVLERFARRGSLVASSDEASEDVRRVSIGVEEGAALRAWVVREKATRTLEIGLGYGVSALHVLEGLLEGGGPEPRHVALDPFQETRFRNLGLRALEEAGVRPLVEIHGELSQVLLPAFWKEGRSFDLAFVDGNHRFDFVFLDLFYLARLVKRGGIVFVDDYNYPGIRKAVAFFLANLGWTIEEIAPGEEPRWVAVRTARGEDARDFRYFVDF